MRGVKAGIGLSLAIMVVIILTLTSPLALVAINSIYRTDWAMIGNLGQAYGFASAALSGLAFLAVAYSIRIQQRDSRAFRREAHRPIHMELLRMAIEDPSLAGVTRPDPSESLESKRRYLYANLYVQFWRVNFAHTRVMNESDVKGEAQNLFSGEAGREYWKRSRAGWLIYERPGATARERRFIELLDHVYEESVRHGPAFPYPGTEIPPTFEAQ
jgi:hypothetical protein